MKKLLIIDGNSLGYAANYAVKLRSGTMETQAVFGFFRTMRDLMTEYPDYTPVVLWDGRASWRFDILPEYKSNRESDAAKVEFKESYTAQKPYIQEGLAHLGVRQLTVYTHEADDMAGLLVERLSKDPENQIILITGDRDWIQLVRPNVTWRDLRDDSRICNWKNFVDYTGYSSPLRYLEGKCLTGDTSDCIPGVGIGEKGAPEFMAEFGSVKEFLDKCDAGFVPKYKKHQKLASPEGRLQFMKNLKLMQLLRIPAPDKSQIKDERGEFNEEKFGEVCEILAFRSITKNLAYFVKPFNKD